MSATTQSFSGKFCNKCNAFKLNYHKDSSKSDGFCTICADCKKLNTKNWNEKNPIRARENSLKYYHSRKKDPEFAQRRKDVEKIWRLNNPDRRCANEAKRRSKKLNATPIWLSDAHKAHIQRTYSLCQIASEATGEKYHVDHIVPLQGKNVCGLHVPWNLRVIPAKMNIRKGNRYEH